VQTVHKPSEFTEFTDATNDVEADGISEHRLTPIQLTIQSNTNFILFPVPGIFVCGIKCIYCSAVNAVLS